MNGEFGIERWVDKHGHDSPVVAHLIVSKSNDDELEAYVWLLLNEMYPDEVIDYVLKINELYGDEDV